jgi:hypothetical protein
MVATFVQLTCAQLELNVGSQADSGDEERGRRIQPVSAVPFSATIRYPDPVDAHSYYVRVTHPNGTISFPWYTCPNDLFFNPGTELCQSSIIHLPVLLYNWSGACADYLGFYCVGTKKFTYCTPDRLPIVSEKRCGSRKVCIRGRTSPCVP